MGTSWTSSSRFWDVTVIVSSSYSPVAFSDWAVSCFDFSSWAAAKGAEKKLEINATANITATTPAGKNLSFPFFIAFPPLTSFFQRHWYLKYFLYS